MRYEGIALGAILLTSTAFVLGIAKNLEEPSRRPWHQTQTASGSVGLSIGETLPFAAMKFLDTPTPNKESFDGFVIQAGACSACTLDGFEAFRPTAKTKAVLIVFEVSARDLQVALKGRKFDSKIQFAADPTGSLKLWMKTSASFSSCFVAKSVVNGVMQANETFALFEKRMTS